MIIWTGKVEVTPRPKSHLITWALQCPNPPTGVFSLVIFNELCRSDKPPWIQLEPTCFEIQSHVCHRLDDDVGEGRHCRCSICSGNRIRLNPKGDQAYLWRIFPPQEHWWKQCETTVNPSDCRNVVNATRWPTIVHREKHLTQTPFARCHQYIQKQRRWESVFVVQHERGPLIHEHKWPRWYILAAQQAGCDSRH